MINSATKNAKQALKEGKVKGFVQFKRHLDNNIFLTKKNEMCVIFEVDGKIHESASASEINAWKHAFNNMLIGLASTRTALWSYTLREYNNAYPDGEFRNAFCDKLNTNYKKKFLDRNPLINRHFFVLILGEARGIEGRIKKRNNTTEKDRKLNRNDDKELLKEKIETITQSLSDYGVRLLSLYESKVMQNDIYSDPTNAVAMFSEPAEFLARLYNGYWSKIPLLMKDIGNTIQLCRPVFGKETIELRHSNGSVVGGIIGIKEYAEFSAAGLINTLTTLQFPVTIAQSFTFISKDKASKAMKLQKTRLEQVDDDSSSQVGAIYEALDDLASGRIVMGYHHISVLAFSDLIVTPNDSVKQLRLLNARMGSITTALSDASILAVRESIATEAAFWAQFPANHQEIPRASMISSINFAGFSSFYNILRGQKEGNYWGDAVTVLPTLTNTPYYFNYHRGDLGHTGIIGMSGSGKTAIMNFLAAQSRKYNSKLFYFDKDKGSEIFIRSLNGIYLELESGMPTGFNPFQIEGTKGNKAFLKRFITSLSTSIEKNFTAKDSEDISEAVEAMYDGTIPVKERRIKTLVQMFPSTSSIPSKLIPWIEDGQYGWTFDNPEDTLNLEDKVIGFDMTSWIDDEILRAPIIAYIMQRITNELDGSKVQIMLDEGWKALDVPEFSVDIKNWFLVVRKLEGMIVMATQSPSQLEESSISDVLVEQFSTLILAANEKAKPKQYIDYLGLTDTEYSDFKGIIKGSHEYMIKQGDESLIVKLDLGNMDDELAVLSGRKTTNELCTNIRNRVGNDPANWLHIFHEERKKL